MFASSLAPVPRVWRVQRGGPHAFLNPILGAALLAATLSGPAWAHGPALAQAQSGPTSRRERLEHASGVAFLGAIVRGPERP